jgi:hypothetical protein
MAEALLITRTDLVKFTAMNGNVDTDKFIQYIKIAQDIHIQGYLGTDLLDKIKADIVAATLTGDYLTLVETYVKPMLIHWAMVEYMPFAAYTIANKGVYKHSSENSENVDKIEVDFLIEKERKIAEHYTTICVLISRSFLNTIQTVTAICTQTRTLIFQDGFYEAIQTKRTKHKKVKAILKKINKWQKRK